VSIKSFLDYKNLLQENYVEYEHISLPLHKLVSKILCHVMSCLKKKYVCIPRSFLVIFVIRERFYAHFVYSSYLNNSYLKITDLKRKTVVFYK
jgi:hypothetical protein